MKQQQQQQHTLILNETNKQTNVKTHDENVVKVERL